MKRLLDLIFVFIGVILFSPILILMVLITMICIIIEDGFPVLYSQKRLGFNRNEFELFKFRSMIKDAEKETGPVWASKSDDVRLTKTGKFIRKYAIDEIPQLINIFKGDISFVGPRPQVERDVLLYTENEQKLLTIRPGITDLASIVFADEGEILRDCAAPNLEYNRLIRPWKSRLGLIYIENQSLELDLRLFFLTALVLISWPWALKGVHKILCSLEAEETLIRVCKRKDPLIPYPPPGSSQVVVERTSKPLKPNSA